MCCSVEGQGTGTFKHISRCETWRHSPVEKGASGCPAHLGGHRRSGFQTQRVTQVITAACCPVHVHSPVDMPASVWLCAPLANTPWFSQVCSLTYSGPDSVQQTLVKGLPCAKPALGKWRLPRWPQSSRVPQSSGRRTGSGLVGGVVLQHPTPHVA